MKNPTPKKSSAVKAKSRTKAVAKKASVKKAPAKKSVAKAGKNNPAKGGVASNNGKGLGLSDVFGIALPLALLTPTFAAAMNTLRKPAPAPEVLQKDGTVDMLDYADKQHTSFNAGNIIKYVGREQQSYTEYLKDLHLAQYHLTREIELVKVRANKEALTDFSAPKTNAEAK